MDALKGKQSTQFGKKINELVSFFTSLNTTVGGHTTTIGSHTTSIGTANTNIAAILAGNVAENIAAAGSTGADAAVLNAAKFIHRVSGADANKGVILPTGVIGMVHIIVNPVNAILKIYPQAAEKIDSGTAGASISGTALYAYIMVYESAAVGWNTTKFLVAD